MSKKVLVIEDSPTMRSLIATTLEEIQQTQIIEADNGFEALRVLPQEKFDLIITDINMPNINGLEIIHFVKNNPNYKSIPVIIITTENKEEDVKKGLALGASEYITKPFNPDDLRAIVTPFLVRQTEG